MAGVWQQWADTGTASYTTGDVFNMWISNADSTTCITEPICYSTASTTTAWIKWIGTGTATTDDFVIYSADNVYRQWIEQPEQHLSKEQRKHAAKQAAAARRREAEYQAERQRQWDERIREADAANDRAERLLIGCLTQEQRKQWKREKAFVVHGRSGRRYRIRQGTHGNIDVVDRNGRGMHRLCVQPSGVPTHDAMLAQKLWLENDEDGILRIANQQPWPGNEPPARRPLILPTLQ